MTFKEAIAVCFDKFAVFSGRASLLEFWYWMIFFMLGMSGLYIIDEMIFPEQVAGNFYPATLTFLALTLTPGLAVGCRRLHDIGKNGWWLWLLPTLIGYIVLVMWWLKPGQPGPNAWGDPVTPQDS